MSDTMRPILKALAAVHDGLAQAFRMIQKAHVKGHIRTLEDGKTIWIQGHDTKREGRAATMHERTAIGKHKDGSHYLRASDKEDARDVERTILKMGFGHTARYKKAQANHLGRKGSYDHFHFDDPAHAKAVHDELKKAKDLPEEMSTSLFDAAGLGPDGHDKGEQQSLGLEDEAPATAVKKSKKELDQEAWIAEQKARHKRLAEQVELTEPTDAKDTRPGLYYLKAEKILVHGPYDSAQAVAYPLYLGQEGAIGSANYSIVRAKDGETPEANTGAWTPGPYYEKKYPMPSAEAPKAEESTQKVGDTMQKDGKTYRLNENHRWEKAEDEAPEKQAGPATWESFSDMRKRLDSGEITADEVRAHWAQFKQDRGAIESAFNAAKKADIVKSCGLNPESRAAKGTKANLIKDLLEHMEAKHNVRGPLSYQLFGDADKSRLDAMETAVMAQTDEDIQKHSAGVKQAKEERQAQYAHHRKSIDNPETLGEFENRKRFKAPPLTAEQQRKYDELKAEAGLGERQEAAEAKATIAPVALGEGVGMELKQTKHTKTGEDLHVVTMTQRVERDKYDELNKKAKKLGGWYSSFKGAGAIPGFQFKSEDAAKQFMGLGEGQAADTSATVEAKAEEKKARVSNKLLDLADSMDEKAAAVLNADRKVNTARRADMASGQIGAAQAQIALAQTLRNLGDAMEAGDLQFLAGVSARSQVEQLNKSLRDARRDGLYQRRDAGEKFSHTEWEHLTHAEPTVEDVDHAIFPWPTCHADNLNHYLGEGEKISGAKQASARLRRFAHLHTDGKGKVIFDTAQAVEDWAKVASSLPRNSWVQTQIKDNFIAPGARLQAAGITNEHELRAALREFVQYKGQKPKSDPVKEAERALAGVKIPGYFPTPVSLASEIVEKADIQPGMKILEPSAGKGNIIDAIRQQHGQGVEVDAIEPVGRLRDILEAKGHTLAGRDIMEHEGQYDRVVMNPPFENRQDVDHVRKAYDLLKPGGKIVAIMSEGPFFGSDKKASEFRDWLSDKGSSEKNPEGSFKTTEAERHTGVATRTVVITKPAGRTAPEGPKDGDTDENGLVFRGGRWHREGEPAKPASARFDRARSIQELHAAADKTGAPFVQDHPARYFGWKASAAAHAGDAAGMTKDGKFHDDTTRGGGHR